MRVLVACEFSAIVRDAFRARGHDAWSCDLIATEGDPDFHVIGDAVEVAHGGGGWDLVIAHPPCTFLAHAGLRWLDKQEGRRAKMVDSATFFRQLLDSPAHFVAVENPIIHRHAREIIGRKHDQVIQPWMFGHTESKATCLWLKNLPKLKTTKNVYLDMMALSERERNRVHWESPGADRWKARSRSLPNIAAAMAKQWGTVIES